MNIFRDSMSEIDGTIWHNLNEGLSLRKKRIVRTIYLYNV